MASVNFSLLCRAAPDAWTPRKRNGSGKNDNKYKRIVAATCAKAHAQERMSRAETRVTSRLQPTILAMPALLQDTRYFASLHNIFKAAACRKPLAPQKVAHLDGKLRKVRGR